MSAHIKHENHGSSPVGPARLTGGQSPRPLPGDRPPAPAPHVTPGTAQPLSLHPTVPPHQPRTLPTSHTNNPLLTKGEVATFCQVSCKTVERWMKRGSLM